MEVIVSDNFIQKELAKIMQFSDDRFMKYLFKFYPDLRLYLCQLLLDDPTLEYVDIQNVERATKKYKGKFPINDFVGRISEDCIINIEVQNNGVYEEEYDRVRAYGMFLLTEQYTAGDEYQSVGKVIQIIINTSGGLETLNHYKQHLEVMDMKYRQVIKEDKLTTIIYNTKYLKEERDMAKELSELDQFMYLMHNNELHSYSKPSKKLQQIQEAHAMYLASEAERFGFYKELVDEVYDRQKLGRAKREGREEGKKEGRYNEKKSILQRLLLNKYKVNLDKELEECTEQRLDDILEVYLNNGTLEEIRRMIE